jgi:hypothetical protein
MKPIRLISMVLIAVCTAFVAPAVPVSGTTVPVVVNSSLCA